MLGKHSASEPLPSHVYVYMHYFRTGPYYMIESGFEVHSVNQAGFKIGIFLERHVPPAGYTPFFF